MGNTDKLQSNASGDAAHTAPRVLVVDDEAAIVEMLTLLLAKEGFAVAAFTDPASALEMCADIGFDLAIIDLMMPDMNGLELCVKMREHTRAPILFLSANNEESNQITGLTLGADDYITKPFKPRELVARIHANLRRASIEGVGADSHIIRARDIEIDLKTHKASLLGCKLQLTPKEFGILALLLRRPDEPVSGKEIFEGVWDEKFDKSGANSVMVHIRHLRGKLSEIDSSREFIQTVWGVGYRFLGKSS